MPLRDSWHRTLVYFGLAEETDEYDDYGPEPVTEHAEAALGKKLEQVAHQDERERDKEKENQRGECGEDDDVLVVARAEELQLKGGLRNQNDEE